MIDWWEGAAGALGGAVLGGCIPLGWAWWRRRVERRGEIDAMQAELFRVLILLRELRTAKVGAPLYRLPISVTEHALPKLIGDGVLTDQEGYALVEYVNRIDEVNRGLDQAAEAYASRNLAWLDEEYKRNLLKATAILEEQLERHQDQTIFDAAQAVLVRITEGGGRMRRAVSSISSPSSAQ